jgi:hypothetical protein
MTVAEARREYRRFMSRMDVAFAFGHGCSMSGSHPTLRALRDEADRCSSDSGRWRRPRASARSTCLAGS